MDTSLLTILVTLFMVGLLSIGMPIAFSLGLAGAVGILLLQGMPIALNALGLLPFSKVCVYALSVLPLFILMGQLAFSSKISEDLFSAGNKWFGRVPGGLGIATVFAGVLFGACCGSSVAQAAAIGKVAIPEMRKYGYDNKLSTGVCAVGGLLAILIPPSLTFIIYGILTGESIGRLFIAGIVPGIITATSFAVLILIRVIKNPALAPRTTEVVNWKEKILSLSKLWAVFVLFAVVMGGIWGGFFTPGEAASVGSMIALLVVFLSIWRKKTDWGYLLEGLKSAMHAITMIFTIIIGAGIFTFFFLAAGVPTSVANYTLSLAVPPLVILVIVCLIYIPLGMFLEPMSILLITVPLFYPILMKLGYNGIWFGVLVTKLIEIADLTPPVGMNVYVIHGVAPDVPLEDIFQGVMWFIFVEMLLMVLLIAFPQICTWLPDLLMKG